MSVQGYMYTRNDLSDVVGVCTKFMLIRMRWPLLLVQEWEMRCCVAGAATASTPPQVKRWWMSIDEIIEVWRSSDSRRCQWWNSCRAGWWSHCSCKIVEPVHAFRWWTVWATICGSVSSKTGEVIGWMMLMMMQWPAVPGWPGRLMNWAVEPGTAEGLTCQLRSHLWCCAWLFVQLLRG